MESLEWFIITIIALYLLEQFGLVFPIIGVDFYQHSIFDVNLFLNVFCWLKESADHLTQAQAAVL